MSDFSPRILFILQSVTIMNVIFSEIKGKLCTSVMLVYDWRFWISGIRRGVGGRVVPDVQKPSEQSSKKLLLGDDDFKILRIIGNHSQRRNPQDFHPQKNSCEKFTYYILCSPWLLIFFFRLEKKTLYCLLFINPPCLTAKRAVQ